MATIRTASSQNDPLSADRPVRRPRSIAVPLLALLAAACAIFALIAWGRGTTSGANLTDVQKQLDVASAELARTKEQLATASSRVTDLQRTNDEAKRAQADAEAQNASRLEELARGRSDLETQLASKTQEVQALQGRYEGEAATLRSQLEALQGESAQVGEELTQARAEANALREQLAMSQNETEELRARVEQMQQAQAAPATKSRR